MAGIEPSGDVLNPLRVGLRDERAVEAAVQAVQSLPGDAEVRTVAEAFARGALLGARGNSGIISAQLLRGWADVLAEREVMDAGAVKEAFARGDAQAWAAVNRPVEGTILSVSRASAQAAATARDRLADVASAAVRAARTALERTPEQLEVLRRSGVVDAGGRGLVVILETLEDVVRGQMTATIIDYGNLFTSLGPPDRGCDEFFLYVSAHSTSKGNLGIYYPDGSNSASLDDIHEYEVPR